MPDLVVPYKYEPRPYQRRVLRALDDGASRVVAVWHRRAGKDKTFLNHTIRCAVERVGTYFYAYPTYTQAKLAIWDGMDRDGFPYRGHFPPGLVRSTNETELQITLVNGSVVKLVGTDNVNSLMSSNPVGVVFSEYSLQDPAGWNYLRPILTENGGWAIFAYTPRGKNHGYELYDMALNLMQDGDPRWYCERLTIEDTGVLSTADLEIERREGMDEELIQQEYYCSFTGVQHGSIFGLQMEAAEREGRICAVPWQRELAVDTWWDIGTSDATAIWFTQNAGREVHVIDYYENAGAGVGIDHYAAHLQGLPYVWGTHTGPHDIEHKQFAAGGKSTREIAAGLGLRFAVNPRRPDKQAGIEAARAFIGRCWFDRAKTERGRLALASYHRCWDDKRRMFSSAPDHDWSSHAADAWQELAAGHKFAAPERPKRSPAYQRLRPAAAGPQSWMGI